MLSVRRPRPLRPGAGRWGAGAAGVTRVVSDWNEIDYVKVSGYDEGYRRGAFRADQVFAYAPRGTFCGNDTLAFRATDCGFRNARDSPAARATFAVAATSDDCGSLDACAAGEFYDRAGAACAPCPPDTFAATAGARDACEPCGSYEHTLAASGAAKC